MSDLKFKQRKTVNIHWDREVVKGGTVTIEANSDDQGDYTEVRSGLDNDGWATITFPSSFTGPCSVKVKGSHGGEQSGSVDVK